MTFAAFGLARTSVLKTDNEASSIQLNPVLSMRLDQIGIAAGVRKKTCRSRLLGFNKYHIKEY